MAGFLLSAKRRHISVDYAKELMIYDFDLPSETCDIENNCHPEADCRLDESAQEYLCGKY